MPFAPTPCAPPTSPDVASYASKIYNVTIKADNRPRLRVVG